jgi:hypothetical protein
LASQTLPVTTELVWIWPPPSCPLQIQCNSNIALYSDEIFLLNYLWDFSDNVCHCSIMIIGVFSLERSPTKTVLASFGHISVLNKTAVVLFNFCLLGRTTEKRLITRWKCSLTVEDKYQPVLVCFVRLYEVFVRRCWQQSVQCCVTVPSSSVSYSNKLIYWEICTERNARECTVFAPA